jgi:hypothetical protein
MLVHERARLDALLLRRALIASGVLVGPRQKEDLTAALTVEPGERVGAGLFVSVMEPGAVVDVVDRRRDVELLGAHLGILGRT